jgi:hypothetical protein
MPGSMVVLRGIWAGVVEGQADRGDEPQAARQVREHQDSVRQAGGVIAQPQASASIVPGLSRGPGRRLTSRPNRFQPSRRRASPRYGNQARELRTLTPTGSTCAPANPPRTSTSLGAAILERDLRSASAASAPRKALPPSSARGGHDRSVVAPPGPPTEGSAPSSRPGSHVGDGRGAWPVEGRRSQGSPGTDRDPPASQPWGEFPARSSQPWPRPPSRSA